MNKEEDEEELGLGEVISNIIRQLEGQIIGNDSWLLDQTKENGEK